MFHQGTSESSSSLPLELGSHSGHAGGTSPVISSVLRSKTLLDGSPSYKQRKRKASGDHLDPGVSVQAAEATLSDPSYRNLRQTSAPSASSIFGPTHFDPSSLSIQSLRRFVGASALKSGERQVTRHRSYDNSDQFSLSRHSMPTPSSGSWQVPTLSSTYYSGLTDLDNSDTASELRSAEVLVPGERALSCPLYSCGKVFRRVEHLKRHVRTHTQEKPYECTQCFKRFSRSDNLSQHLRTHSRSSRDSSTGSDSCIEDGSGSVAQHYDMLGPPWLHIRNGERSEGPPSFATPSETPLWHGGNLHYKERATSSAASESALPPELTDRYSSSVKASDLHHAAADLPSSSRASPMLPNSMLVDSIAVSSDESGRLAFGTPIEMPSADPVITSNMRKCGRNAARG